MPRFEIEAGLPPYGPVAEPFSKSGRGTHGEGLVVRFTDSRGRHWHGNFQPGSWGVNAVLDHPDGHRVIVISSGQGYFIDPDNRARREYFGSDLRMILPVPGWGVIFGNGLWFEAVGVSGVLWISDRISWDGRQAIEILGQCLKGGSLGSVERLLASL